jgi:hypothetical protein
MAVGALAGHSSAMVIAGAVESGCVEVAGLARRIGDDVLEGLGRRDDAFAGGMATVAGARRTDEHTADMASLAGDRGMHTGQRVAGRQVVELAILRLGRSLRLE